MGKTGTHHVTESERHLCNMLRQEQERRATAEKETFYAQRREGFAHEEIARLTRENEALTKRVAELEKQRKQRHGAAGTEKIRDAEDASNSESLDAAPQKAVDAPSIEAAGETH